MGVRLTSHLRIWSSVLSGSELAERFQQPRARTHQADELMSRRNPRSQRREYSSWHLEAELPPEATLSEHLAWATSVMSSLPQPREGITGADVFVGAFLEDSQGSFELTDADAAALASVGLSVVFDVYGPDELDPDALAKRGDVQAGWNPTLDMPSALGRVPAGLRPRYVLLTVVDSGVGVRRLTSLLPLLRELGEFHLEVDEDVALEVSTLLRLADEHGFLNGFDEVWLCTELPTAGKPEQLRITSDREIGAVPATDLLEWMREAHCVAGLGDGVGLNYVTVDESLAALWRNPATTGG